MLKYTEIIKAAKYQYTWVFKIVFSFALLYLLYYQLCANTSSGLPPAGFLNSVSAQSMLYISLTVLLMLLNWGIEALKWKMLLENTEPVSFIQSFKSIVSGVAVSMFTPNRTGEFLGRMMYVQKQNRLSSVALSVTGNIAQWTATLFFGAVALVLSSFLNHPLVANPLLIHIIFYGTVTGCLFSFLIYFGVINFSLFVRFKRFHSFIARFATGELNFGVLCRILSFSFLRYIVFLVQYFLLLKAFNIQIMFLDAVILISLILLIITLIPTVAMGEIGLRGNVALFFLNPYTNNQWGVICAALLIWIINLLIPALIGGAVILHFKSSNNNYEKALA